MLEELSKRLEMRRLDYETLLQQEHTVEEIYSKFAHLQGRQQITVSVYGNALYFYIYPENFDFSEEKLIPYLSEVFSVVWAKRVSEDEVIYQAQFIWENKNIYINIMPRVKGTCRIIKVATGNTKMSSKWVEFEVPEFEYLVDCGEED